jgi:glucosamine--fructose-6-phosphate aminotransferase (isomerizing)
MGLEGNSLSSLPQTGHLCHSPNFFQNRFFKYMCGIVGYVGRHEAAPVLLDGLRRLEYRGYDSAGIAVREGNGSLLRRRTVGRIQNLASLVEKEPAPGSLGISHTRWATHGGVTVENAHPHFDRTGCVALVHNGVLENYRELRAELEGEGVVFSSQTDTEVLAALIGRELENIAETPTPAQFQAAVEKSLRRVTGTYGIAVIHRDLPDYLIGARRGSPLVLGIGRDEHFLASDVAAMVSHTREVVYLKDYEIAVLHPEEFSIHSLTGAGCSYEINTVEFGAEEVSKGDYPHYMLKEIFEQPRSLRDTMRGRLSREEATTKLGGLNMTNAELRAVERVVLCGCGTAHHAAMVGEYLIESLALLPTECEFASELRYRNLPMTKDSLVFVISQSGETADTLAALRECQRKGLRTLGICNNVGSTIARESDGGVYMHAGPEIGVAATKSFTSQVLVLLLLAVLMGRIRHLSSVQGRQILAEMEALPEKIERILTANDRIAEIARRYVHCQHFLFMGRQGNYPVALEGALKLKEISYLPAAGHPSAELKHGVIALINPTTPTVVIAPDDAVFEKNLGNIEEIKARQGPVIAIGTEGNQTLPQLVDDFIGIPAAPDYLTPILASIPLQLFAYHLAVALGCDVDKPRNLAKSVTVE